MADHSTILSPFSDYSHLWGIWTSPGRADSGRLPHFEVKISEILRGHRHDVRLVTRIFHRLDHERLDVLRLHAVVAQLGVEADARQKLGDEGDRALVGFVVRTRHQVETGSHPHAPVKAGAARGAELHAGAVAQRVGQAVMQSAE